MKYTNKDMGSYNIHLIKTDKYKTITIRVMFKRKIKKEEITIRNVLASLLVQSTNKYNSKRKMTIEAHDLYSARLAVDNSRAGNYINTIFTLNVLNDKYTESGNFKKSLEFLNEVIFNPDVEDNKFKEKNIDIVMNRTRTELSSIKEDPNTYSLVRAMESFDSKSPVSYRMMGYLEDLDTIDGESLYKYYNEMINKDFVDIAVIGDINEEMVVNEIKKYFKLRILKRPNKDFFLPNKRPRARRLFGKETIEATQSRLNIICRLGKLTKYERDYVLPVLNVIFGGGADSKLFKIVREQHSLCYTIYSKPKRLDNILIIRTGINRENYQKTLKLIEKILSDMKKGKFSEDDINIAKQYFETAFDELEEDPNSAIDLYLSKMYYDTDDLDVKRKNIMKVSKNELVKVAKKIHMDTVFELEGDKDEEDGI